MDNLFVGNVVPCSRARKPTVSASSPSRIRGFLQFPKMSREALDPGISDGAAFTAVTADCRSRRAAEWDHRWGLSGESGIALLPVGVQNGRVAPNKREGDYQAEPTQSDIGRRNSQIGWGLLA